jgi:hypothetical protein
VLEEVLVWVLEGRWMVPAGIGGRGARDHPGLHPPTVEDRHRSTRPTPHRRMSLPGASQQGYCGFRAYCGCVPWSRRGARSAAGPDGNVLGPAQVVSHVQAEPAELVAQLVDGPEQLVGPLGVGAGLDVPFAVEQKALQMVHLRDGSNHGGPGQRHLRPDYTRRGVLGRKRRSGSRRGWHRR